jgi:hypothetical protein
MGGPRLDKKSHEHQGSLRDEAEGYDAEQPLDLITREI